MLVLAYLVQALAMGATAAAILSGAREPVVIVFEATAATAITITRPAQGALLPELSATPAELTAANAASTSIEGMCVLLGHALAGIILHLSGPGEVFAAMAGWLLVSTLMAGSVRNANAGSSDRRRGEGAVGEGLRGFRSLASQPDASLVVALVGAHEFVWGLLDVLIVILAIQVLHIGKPGVGYLNSALGLGALGGGIAAVALAGRPRLLPALGLGVLLWGVSIALFGAIPAAIAPIVFLALAGSGHSLIDVAARTLLQRVSPPHVLSRVLGVLEGLMMASLAVGAIIAPVLVRWLGARGAFALAGAFLPVLAALTTRRLGRVDEEATVASKGVELLRPISIFARLAPAAIEGLAAALLHVDVTAGTTVMRQGDVGDRFYVVEAGELDVSVDGRHVSTDGPGDHFGEIALLRDVPRTATVTARTDARLHALDRDTFIEAVTGHPSNVRAADDVIDARLKSGPG